MQTLLPDCSVRKLQPVNGDIENTMRNNGMRHSRLAVDKGNPQSYSFWTKNGYAVCGPEIPNDFSAYIPMQKELTPL